MSMAQPSVLDNGHVIEEEQMTLPDNHGRLRRRPLAQRFTEQGARRRLDTPPR
jgi:hypothetical protein